MHISLIWSFFIWLKNFATRVMLMHCSLLRYDEHLFRIPPPVIELFKCGHGFLGLKVLQSDGPRNEPIGSVQQYTNILSDSQLVWLWFSCHLRGGRESFANCYWIKIMYDHSLYRFEVFWIWFKILPRKTLDEALTPPRGFGHCPKLCNLFPKDRP